MAPEKQRSNVQRETKKNSSSRYFRAVLGLPQTFKAVIGDLRRIVFRDLDAGGFHAVVGRAELP